MKRLAILILAVFITGFAFGAGSEEQKDMTIVVAGVGVGMGTEEAPSQKMDLVYSVIMERYPFVTIETIDADIATGEDVTMLALLAAGTPPDIYTDFEGRAGKYVTPAFALPLEVDESLYFGLAKYKRGGKLLALPENSAAQGMVINTSLLDEIGYTLPDTWTIEDFLGMCAAVKAAGIEDVYGTGLFAANPSADYLWVNWFASFGITNFFNDDYTRSLADGPGFLAAWRFFDTLMREGYIHPNAAMWPVSPDFLGAIGAGTMAAYGARIGWADGMQSGAIANGKSRTGRYEWIVRQFPSADGQAVTIAPAHIAVGHKTDDPVRAEIITELLLLWTGPEVQTANTRLSGVPSRTDVPLSTTMNKGEDFVVDIAQNVGMLDVGFANSWYYETRSAGPKILQPLLKGDITPEQAHVMYFELIQAIIGN